MTSDHIARSDATSHSDVTSHDMTDAEALRLDMRDMGLTQAELAGLFGVSRETVSRWSTGKLEHPLWLSYAMDGLLKHRTRKAIAAPSKPAGTPKPIAAPTAPKPIAKPVQPSKPRPIDCSPPPVPGKWRFGVFYPD